MRIRQIKPSWWLDKPLRHLNADVREFYIGLWQLADDAGWLVWDLERIGAELYPYATVSRRERNVANWAERLAELDPEHPHLVLWTCGHAQVPKMAGHQRIAGKLVVSVKERHLSCDAERLGEPKLANNGSGRVGKEVGNGTRAMANGGPSDFQAKVPRVAALGKS